MDDYNSKFTGPEIDAAIDRAKAGGAIDTLLANKAPAGYGLGGGATKTVETDFNNYIDNGVYQCPASFDSIQNAPPNGHYGMLIVSHGSNAIVQDVYGPSWVSSAIRWFHVRRVSTSSDGNADSWSEWEWPEPLMEIGVEYRTTERYQGKPVYTIMMPSKTLGAAGSTVYIEGLPGDIEDVIDYRLQIKTSGGVVTMNNLFNSDGSAQCVSSVQVTTEHYAWALIKCISDCTSLTATCTFKYTKTTD